MIMYDRMICRIIKTRKRISRKSSQLQRYTRELSVLVDSVLLGRNAGAKSSTKPSGSSLTKPNQSMFRGEFDLVRTRRQLIQNNNKRLILKYVTQNYEDSRLNKIVIHLIGDSDVSHNTLRP